MEGIREELTLVDHFSGTFNQFNVAANASIYTAQAFKNALDQFTEGYLDGLTEELQRTNSELDEAANGSQRAAQGANEAADAQKRVTDETKASADAAAGWVSKIKSAVVALGAVKFAKEFVESADNMAIMNQRLESVGASQEEVFKAAQRARTEYSTVADLVSGIGRNAKNTFTNTKDTIQFAENMSKAFKIAGTDQAGMASATLQLNQALASGVLRGEEFNAVNENAHNIIELIAKEMNEPVEKMKDLASEGKITGDVIKNAVLGATGKIEKEFQKLPMTFADVTTLFGNYLNNALSDKYMEWSEFLNSDEGMALIEDIANALVLLADIGTSAFMAIANAVQFVHQNWEELLPIINLVAAAVMAYYAVKITASVTAAAAMAAEYAPLMAVIGAFFLGITVLQQFGVTFAQMGNVAGHVIGGIYAVAYNAVMLTWNAVDWLCNNFNAVVNNTGADVMGVINAIGQTALDMVWTVADAIDSVFGSNLSGAVNSLKGNLQGWVDSFGSRQEYTAFNVHEYKNIGDTAAEFGAIGEKLGGKLDGIGDTLGGIFDGVHDLGDYAGISANSVGGTGEVGKVGSVGKIDNDVKLSDEDIKIYRDLAEQRYMNRVELKTLAPNIQVTMPDGSNLSPSDVANAIKAVLEEQMSANAAVAH